MSQQKPRYATTPLNLPLEGRLLAHRRLLVELLRALPKARQAEMMDWLDERALYVDGQEDPGAVPGEGIEFELSRADQFQVLKRLFKRQEQS